MTNSVSSSDFTARQYHETVIALLEGAPSPHNITPAQAIAHAKAEIAKLDATNAKRTEKAKEKAKENEPLKTAIFDFLVANGTKTTTEIAAGVEVLGGSSPKASAMCRQMVDEGRLTSSDVSVKGKGKQKAYTAVVSAE